MNEGLIFATSVFGRQLDWSWWSKDYGVEYMQKHMSMYKFRFWINYHKEFFPDFDLLLVNDGPTDQTFPDCKVLPCDPHLGRQTVIIFPGWKRGFAHGLKYGLDNMYKHIVHCESDCFVKPKFANKYRELFKQPGVHCGYSNKVGFMESSIISFTDHLAAAKACTFFMDPQVQYSTQISENQLDWLLQPKRTFIGDRVQGEISMYSNDALEYVAQCDVSEYEDFLIGGK